MPPKRYRTSKAASQASAPGQGGRAASPRLVITGRTGAADGVLGEPTDLSDEWEEGLCSIPVFQRAAADFIKDNKCLALTLVPNDVAAPPSLAEVAVSIQF